jgi:L-ascorbate metabolism protein UlaG (beta-lactamase superfamily)
MEKQNLKNKAYQNLSDTPQMAEGVTFFGAMRAFFNKPKTSVPPKELPSVKTDLKNYHSVKPSIFWFGHSSYLIHCDGLNILVDPVFSGYASPVSFYLKAFSGADVYKAGDMPPIDCIILSHNHYDHLDTGTLKLLSGQTKSFIIPVGVSRDLRGLGIDPQRITELDWWQGAGLSSSIKITSTPARHFSGRGLKRNRSLWSSYVLELNGYKIFIGGDSGYDGHFKEIGGRFGPFDIAILECGQYNKMWPYIHSFPEELIDEARDLQAKVILPVHWGKFSLSMHEWDEPIKRFVEAAEKAHVAYATPLIGEPVILDEYYPRRQWWAE